MENAYFLLETGFLGGLQFFILAVEAVGCGLLIISVFRCLIGYFTRTAHLRRILAEGMVLALEFKMGAELLRTVTARSFEELFTLGAVILIRASLTFLLEWEIRSEEKRERAAIGQKQE